MECPILYHKARTGKIHSWKIWTEGSVVKTEHGSLDGKKQISEFIAEPTNVGRSNERNAVQQAEFEARSKWQFQKDRKYSETIEAAHETVFLPMLAHSMEKRQKHLFDKNGNFIPCDIQPKLDGVRCLAFNDEGTIVLLSRQGKEWKHVPHINEKLCWLPVGDCLDGELYVHGQGFQIITSWAKGKNKAPHPQSKNIQYHVYDYPINNILTDTKWLNRRDSLHLVPESDFIKVVQTEYCREFDAISEYHAIFCSQGYEGAILRTFNGEYQFGQRSPDLLKVKSFNDAEYVVIDATCGKPGSREDGKVIWICVTDNGNIFNVRSEGNMEERAYYYENKEKYFGKKLKVKFFELTDDGLPRFPVGIGFRDEID